MRNSYLSGAFTVAMALAATEASALTITALSSKAGYSVIECWRLSSLPVDAMSAVNFAIGSTTGATWSIIEPHTTLGEAWPPSVQLSVILNGLIRITAPSPKPSNCSVTTTSTPVPYLNSTTTSRSTQVAYIMPGTPKSSILIAADTKATSYIAGHYTEFPSNEPTVLVQVPFVDNLVPEHVVLHDGACQ